MSLMDTLKPAAERIITGARVVSKLTPKEREGKRLSKTDAKASRLASKRVVAQRRIDKLELRIKYCLREQQVLAERLAIARHALESIK